MNQKTPDFEEIFHAALEIESSAERQEFLLAQCGEDSQVLSELKAMLASHKELGSFLDKPPADVQETVIGQAEEDLAASLEAGLSQAFPGGAAVLIGNSGHSVLKSLGKLIDVPHVALREPKAEGEDPLMRPKSAEIPERNSDSRYQLQREIARGGMGAIIKGRDVDLGRDLAIKVLLDEHKAKPEVIQRFVEEAQIGGQLQHPGIAPVYELGQFADKRPFFSMKLVKGETLSRLLAARENPAEDRSRFLGIFEQICQTMAYAHSRGVIHRDLKPANIMVGSFGEVQVMDWGLAKVLPAGGVEDEKLAHTKHKDISIIQTMRSVGSDTPGVVGSVGSQTQMGSIMGTPAYMPPEQALGEIDQMDEHADVFGLGAILCEILTGKPPYVADDGTQVFRMASRGKLEDCMARLDACDADPELIALTKECLELEPVDRPADAGALAERVTGYLESVESRLREAEIQRASEAARADAETAQRIAENHRADAESRRAAAESARAQEERKRRRTTLALAASVLLLFGLGGGSWLYQERQEAQRQEAEAIAQTRHANEQTLHAQEMEALAKEKEQLRKEAVEALRIAEIRGYDSALAAAKSDLERNDSRSLRQRLSRQPEHLRGWEWDYLWNISDSSVSTPLQLPAASDGYAMTISDDGTLVASRPDGAGEWPISIHDARTGELVREIKTHSSSHPRLEFSRDKRYLAYSFHGTHGIQIYDVATGAPKIPDNLSPTYESFLGFDQAGDHAVLVESTKTSKRATLFQIEGWQAKGSFPEGHLSRIEFFGQLPLAVSPDGNLLVVATKLTLSGGISGCELGICSLTSKEVVKKIEIPEVPSKLWINRNGTHLVVLSSNGVTPYSITTGEPEDEPIKFENGSEIPGLLRMQMRSGGDHTLTFGRQGEVIVLSRYQLFEQARLKGHNASGRSLAVDEQNNEVVAAYADGSVRRWSLEFQQAHSFVRGKSIPSPDGGTFWDGGTVRRWDPILATEIDPVSGTRGVTLAACPPTISHSSTLTGMAFSPDGNRLAVSTTSTWGWGRWRVYDRWTGMPLHVEVTYQDSTCIGWSADGRWIVVGYEVHSQPAGIVRIYDAQTFREVKRIDDFAGQVKDLVLSPDSRLFVTACQDGTLSSWTLPDGNLLHRSGAQGEPEKSCLVWRPQSGDVVSGSIDGSIIVWNPQTGEERARLALHGGPVTSVICSPDGRRVFSGSDDLTIRVLDTTEWREILMLPVSRSPGSMILSADGKLLSTSAGAFDAERLTVRKLEGKRSQEAAQKVDPMIAEAFNGEPDVNQLRERFLTDTTLSEEEKQLALLRIRNRQSQRVALAYQRDNALRLTARLSAREILGSQMNLKKGNRPPADKINQIIQQSLERAKVLDPLEVQVFKEYLPAVLNVVSGPELPEYFLVFLLSNDILMDQDALPENSLYAYFGLAKLLQELPNDQDLLMFLALAEYRVGLYSDAVVSARRSNQLNEHLQLSNLPIIAMAEHRMGNSDAATQTMEQLTRLLSDNRRRIDGEIHKLIEKAREVLSQPAEPWDEVAAWEKCRQSLLDLKLDSAKIADWEWQTITRYAERHKDDPNNAWLAKLSQLLDRQIASVETRLLEDLNQQPVARQLLQLLLQRYPTTSHGILPTAETEAVDWSFTTTPPPDNWMSAEFDHSSWSIGKGGFGKLGAPELNARTEWNTSDIWMRTKFEWQSSEASQPLLLRIIHDDAVEIYLNGTRIINRANWIANYIDLPLKAEMLQAGENVITVHCHQNDGGQHIDVGIAEIRGEQLNVQIKDSVTRVGNLWAKLAVALELVGKPEIRELVIQAHPEVAAAVAESDNPEEGKEAAIAAYSALIDKGNASPVLLTKRAEAYLETGQVDLAKADWQRIIEQQPDQLRQAINVFIKAEQWRVAAEFGLRLCEVKPEESINWLKAAPLHVLTDDPELYGAFCHRVGEHFGQSADSTVVTYVVKACLLRPGAIGLDQLPVEAFEAQFEDGASPQKVNHFRWGLRGLLALRKGEAELAIKHINQAQQLQPSEVSGAFNLAVLAMAELELQHTDAALTALSEASGLMTAAQGKPVNQGHHDLLMAEILLREAEAKIKGRKGPQPSAELDAKAKNDNEHR